MSFSTTHKKAVKPIQRLSSNASAVLTELLERVYDTADAAHSIKISDLENIVSELRRGQP